MTKQTVVDYLVEQGGVVSTFGDRATILTSHGGYDVYIAKTELSMGLGENLRDVDLVPARVEVLMSRALEYLGDRVGFWVDYELVKKVAKKHDIEVGRWKKSQVFVTTAIFKADLDNLIAAVEEYDRLYHSDEVRELERRLPKVIDNELAALLE